MDLGRGFLPGSSVSELSPTVFWTSAALVFQLVPSTQIFMAWEYKSNHLVGWWWTMNDCLLKRNQTFPKLLKSVVVEGHKLRTEVINISYDTMCVMIGNVTVLQRAIDLCCSQCTWTLMQCRRRAATCRLHLFAMFLFSWWKFALEYSHGGLLF